nr:MAG TPA: hypothetical protein [Caudoviricetes sp.]
MSAAVGLMNICLVSARKNSANLKPVFIQPLKN